MRGLRIVSAGPHTTIQDRGRPGRQWLGIPEGGALDRNALALGNALVGNPPDAAILEVCMGNFCAELLGPARIALTGTDEGELTVQGADGTSMGVPANRSVDLEAGRLVRIGGLPDSNTATLAFAGGVMAPLFYDSRSTSPSAGIGGLNGGLVADGDMLELGGHHPGPGGGPELKVAGPPGAGAGAGEAGAFRCVRGPQDDRFTDAALAAFFGEEFKVTPVLDRMGMRLDGPVLEHKSDADIPSDGIVTGSVQVPGNGLPIVLMADHQTTGGYTKIATVITADIPALARLRPGQALRFSEVTVEEAEGLARQAESRRREIVGSLVPAEPIVDLAALYGLGDTT